MSPWNWIRPQNLENIRKKQIFCYNCTSTFQGLGWRWTLEKRQGGEAVLSTKKKQIIPFRTRKNLKLVQLSQILCFTSTIQNCEALPAFTHIYPCEFSISIPHQPDLTTCGKVNVLHFLGEKTDFINSHSYAGAKLPDVFGPFDLFFTEEEQLQWEGVAENRKGKKVSNRFQRNSKDISWRSGCQNNILRQGKTHCRVVCASPQLRRVWPLVF